MAVMDEADLVKKLDDLLTNLESGEEEDLPVGEDTFDAMWL
jgi:hypothetical protein